MKTTDIAGLGLESHLSRMASLKRDREQLEHQLRQLNLTISIIKIKGTSRDWTEDYPHENGLYSHSCYRCHQTFLGHKRRWLCKTCDSQVATVAPPSSI